MEVLAGTIVLVVAINRGAVAGILAGAGTITYTTTTDLIFSLAVLTLLSGFLSQK